MNPITGECLDIHKTRIRKIITTDRMTAVALGEIKRRKQIEIIIATDANIRNSVLLPLNNIKKHEAQ